MEPHRLLTEGPEFHHSYVAQLPSRISYCDVAKDIDSFHSAWRDISILNILWT